MYPELLTGSITLKSREIFGKIRTIFFSFSSSNVIVDDSADAELEKTHDHCSEFDQQILNMDLAESTIYNYRQHEHT